MHKEKVSRHKHILSSPNEVARKENYYFAIVATRVLGHLSLSLSHQGFVFNSEIDLRLCHTWQFFPQLVSQFCSDRSCALRDKLQG